jgi:hypothetical protein
MPRQPKAPKPPKRPSWSIWRHKQKGWLTFELPYLLKSEWGWDAKTNARVEVKSKYVAEDFEELNPAEYTHRATLKFDGIYSGRSAVNFEFRDLEGGQSFSMLLREFERVMKIVDFHQGALSGIWKFEKHGSSVGICLVRELLDEEENQVEP